LVRVYGRAVRVGPESVGRRRFGVPPGGPFDRESHRLALALLNLDETEETWEIAGSAELVAERDGAVAVVGAAEAAAVEGRERPIDAAWPVRAGEQVRIGASRRGARAYVAFRSRSLPERRLASPPTSLHPRAVRLLPGPDAAELPLAGWGVAPASDRLGLRLRGAGVPHATELPSRPTTVGSVQVTPSGMPIVLGPDGPTLGGYPQAAVVAEVDRDYVGQLAPGAVLSFAWTSLEEARAARKAAVHALEHRLAELRAGLLGGRGA
jgi:allophanate hydrolase subunit 2